MTIQEKFDKKFGNLMNIQEGICHEQPCDCCRSTAEEIKQFITDTIKEIKDEVVGKKQKCLIRDAEPDGCGICIYYRNI